MSRRTGSLNIKTIMQRNSITKWKDAYRLILKTKKAYASRLKELETWDNCNGHESERQTKIKALQELLK